MLQKFLDKHLNGVDPPEFKRPSIDLHSRWSMSEMFRKHLDDEIDILEWAENNGLWYSLVSGDQLREIYLSTSELEEAIENAKKAKEKKKEWEKMRRRAERRRKRRKQQRKKSSSPSSSSSSYSSGGGLGGGDPLPLQDPMDYANLIANGWRGHYMPLPGTGSSYPIF